MRQFEKDEATRHAEEIISKSIRGYFGIGMISVVLLIVFALCCAGASAATFTIGSTEVDRNWTLVSPGVWRANLNNATATVTSAALLTVDQNDALAAWQQTAELYFYRNEAGVYSFAKIADANVVTPVASGNRLIWTALWTFAGGTADYELLVTDRRILKYVRFSAAAGAVLPSPTGAAFFPGAPESELGFAIGSDPFVGERAANVTGEMDGAPIDLDDDQVVGVSMTLKWNGAFLHTFLPAYAGMHQGSQIYLGDLQCHFAAWSWADAKDEAEFDPSYTFKAAEYIKDAQLYEANPTTAYGTVTYYTIGIYSTKQTWGVFDIDVGAIASDYGISTVITRRGTQLDNVSLNLTPDNTTGTLTTVSIKYDATPAADAEALTWDTRDTATLPIYAWDASGAVAYATQEISNASLTNKFRACIVSGIHLQLYFIPDWATDNTYIRMQTEESTTYGYRPTITLILAVDDTSLILDAIAASELAVRVRIASVSADIAALGTSDFSANELAIRERIASATANDNANLGTLTTNIDANETKIDALNVTGTAHTGRFDHIDGAISAATAFVSTASSSLTAAISADGLVSRDHIAAATASLNNILFQIRGDTAAGGNIIPASGIASIGMSLYLTQENAWDVQIYGQSLSSSEPNLGFWITQGSLPTTSKTYKLATLGNSITYIGAYDSKVDAAAIGGASVYTHVYTAHYTPADATGVYHIAGICSDGTRAWPIGGDFVFGVTPTLAIIDQLTATAFTVRADAWDTMLDNAAAGEIVSTTVYRANSAIARTTAGINITQATDSVVVPLDGEYGYERTYRKTDGTLYTRRWLADHDEATTNKNTSMLREIGPDTTIEAWATARGHSISTAAKTVTP